MLPLPVAYKIDPMTHFRSSRQLRWAAFLVLLLILPAARAQKSSGFRVVSWSPQRLESGSPVLFQIEVNQPADSLHGTWLDHPLVFNRAHQGNNWYVLAGIDVEQAPGTYPLELTATESNGQELHATQQITVLPGSYKTTTLHVEEKYVQPDAATLARIAADKAVKDAAFAHYHQRAVMERKLSLARALRPDRFLWHSAACSTASWPASIAEPTSMLLRERPWSLPTMAS